MSRAFDGASSARVRDYVDLLKPRVMSLVVFTGVVGVMIAPGHLHPFTAALAVLAIALGSGAAGAINMWYERDLDALMARTRNRPLPAGRVAPADDRLGRRDRRRIGGRPRALPAGLSVDAASLLGAGALSQ